MSDEHTDAGDEVIEVEAVEVDAAETTDADATDAVAGEAAEETGTERVADAAWRDVIAQLDGLAEAAGRWTRAAVDDPENRERARELRDHIEQMAADVGDTIDGAVNDARASDVGQSFKDAASKTGEAFKTAGAAFTNEVAPRMASAFRGAAEGMNRAAEKMERTSPPPPPSAEETEVETVKVVVNEEPPATSADDSPE